MKMPTEYHERPFRQHIGTHPESQETVGERDIRRHTPIESRSAHQVRTLLPANQDITGVEAIFIEGFRDLYFGHI